MSDVVLMEPKKIGFLKWETKVVTPRCTWYYHGWTKKGSAVQALALHKELTRDENGNRAAGTQGQAD